MSQKEKDQLVTPVIFRYWKNEVIALFPADAAYADDARAAARAAYAADADARAAAREAQNGQLEKMIRILKGA